MSYEVRDNSRLLVITLFSVGIANKKMSTINANIPPQRSLSNGTSTVASANGESENAQSIGAPITVAVPVAQGDRVTISGRAMLASRLFRSDTEHYDGKVRTTPLGASGNTYEYLTASDRKMVEDMYEYCAANEIDLAYVDTLALDLAVYRMNGSQVLQGTLYDKEGHRLTVDFQAPDKQIVERIRQSEQLQQTSIDQGFLEAEFIPGGRFADFAFLEKMISVFSPAGETTETHNDSFKVYTPPGNRLSITKSEEIELVIPEPDYVSVNGVGTWRTPELANAHNNKGGLSHDARVAFRSQLTADLLGILTGYAKSKNIAMTHLDELRSLFEASGKSQVK